VLAWDGLDAVPTGRPGDEANPASLLEAALVRKENRHFIETLLMARRPLRYRRLRIEDGGSAPQFLWPNWPLSS
jgi:hypothetical protein